MPPSTALMVKAMTLVRSVCTPMVSAASSLSRTARIARPSRVLGQPPHEPDQQVQDARAENSRIGALVGQVQAEQRWAVRCLGCRPGPWVTSIQFVSTRSKICWKLMVIMAR